MQHGSALPPPLLKRQGRGSVPHAPALHHGDHGAGSCSNRRKTMRRGEAARQRGMKNTLTPLHAHPPNCCGCRPLGKPAGSAGGAGQGRGGVDLGEMKTNQHRGHVKGTFQVQEERGSLEIKHMIGATKAHSHTQSGRQGTENATGQKTRKWKI